MALTAKHSKKNLYLFSLLFIVIAGYFSLPTFASYCFNHNVSSSLLLDYGKTNNLAAYHEYQRRTQQQGSPLWLRSTLALERTQPLIALELANYYQSNKNEQQASFWYKQLSKVSSEEAQLAVAFWHVNHQRPTLAANTFQHPVLARSIVANVELLKLAIDSGNTDLIESSLQQIKLLKPDHPILKQAQSFNVSLHELNWLPQCELSIQPIATRWQDLKKLSRLISQIESSRAAEHFCFAQVAYEPLANLSCHHEVTRRIDCQRNQWSQKLKASTVRYMLVMVPEGGAVVDNGILFLDSSDDERVFMHELLHLAGFIDEYPLPKAHSKCLAAQEHPFSLNIATFEDAFYEEKPERKTILKQVPWASHIAASTPIVRLTKRGWQLGTPKSHQDKVGLFVSETCLGKRNKDIQVNAFKPLHKANKLQFFEYPVPDLYWQLLKEKRYQYSMVPFHATIK